MNYIVEDEMYDFDSNGTKKSTNYTKYAIIVFGVLIVIIFAIFFLRKNNHN